jgi:hypothetical protein
MQTEILRTVIHSDQLTSVIDLPVGLRGQDVEIIVLPLIKSPQQNILQKIKPEIDLKKLKGCLKEYANPKLRELEDGVWEKVAAEKYLDNKGEQT